MILGGGLQADCTLAAGVLPQVFTVPHQSVQKPVSLFMCSPCSLVKLAKKVHPHLVPDEHCFEGILIGTGATRHGLNTTHPTRSHLQERNVWFHKQIWSMRSGLSVCASVLLTERRLSVILSGKFSGGRIPNAGRFTNVL